MPGTSLWSRLRGLTGSRPSASRLNRVGPPPPPPPARHLAAAAEAATRVYARGYRDQPSYLRPSSVSLGTITTAQSQASRGNMRALGDLYQVLRVDPILRAAVGQRKRAAVRAPRSIVAAEDSDRGKACRDLIADALSRHDSGSLGDAIKGILEAELQGGGLVETLWNEPITSDIRYPIGYQSVPLQRLRYGVNGAQRFANDPRDQVDSAKPLTDWPLGTWIPVVVEDDTIDYGDRGAYRSLLADLFLRIGIFASYASALEKYGNPIPVGKAATANARKQLAEAFANLGSDGSIVGDETSEVALIYADIMKNGSSPYSKALEETDQRILLAILGESQTAIIKEGEGSKASAATQREVAGDVVEADWDLISGLLSRHVFAPIVEMNLGPEYVAWTPKIVADLDQPGDLKALADGVKAWGDLGLSIGQSWARTKTKIPEPGPNETPLATSPAASPITPGAPPAGDSDVPDAPVEPAASAGRPIAERLLVGFLPFIKVRELREGWLGLTERIDDDELPCGEFEKKHGGGEAIDPAAGDA